MTWGLRFVGGTYLVLATIVVGANYALVWWKGGFWSLANFLSPLNFTNWLATVLAVLPGVALLAWAGRRQKAGK